MTAALSIVKQCLICAQNKGLNMNCISGNNLSAPQFLASVTGFKQRFGFKCSSLMLQNNIILIPLLLAIMKYGEL